MSFEHHLEVNPLACYLRREFISEDPKALSSLSVGHIIEFTSHPKELLGCTFVSRVGKVFENLPVNAFRWAKYPENKEVKPASELKRPFICPGKTILSYQTGYYKGRKIWTRMANRPMFGHYVMGFSWPNQTKTAILLAMNDGSYQVTNHYMVAEKRPKF